MQTVVNDGAGDDVMQAGTIKSGDRRRASVSLQHQHATLSKPAFIMVAAAARSCASSSRQQRLRATPEIFCCIFMGGSRCARRAVRHAGACAFPPYRVSSSASPRRIALFAAS